LAQLRKVTAMTEQVCVAVPYPMVGLPGVAYMWGPVCPVHPTWFGGNVPSDVTRDSAEAFAAALACAHPDHNRPAIPQAVLNAVIVAAMTDHPHRPEYADRRWFAWCDMMPVVTEWHVGPTDPEYCPDDVWWVEVQYSSKGARAAYGVDRNHVPTCYAD
jgi:hypothetical protein